MNTPIETNSAKAEEPAFRLPTTLKPNRYELTLEPDLETGRFDGYEDIYLTTLAPLRQILINAVELDIHKASIRKPDSEQKSINALSIAPNPNQPERAEQTAIEFGETVTEGQWILSLSFSGILNDKLRGFYRSSFKDKDGQQHWLATTQFEATDARRAFPCFDEPEMKAVFSITLVVEEGLTAISNTPIIEETEVSGETDETMPSLRHKRRRRVRFCDTMPMSTYLVAFIVGELEFTDPVMVQLNSSPQTDPIPLRVSHVPSKGNLCSFALTVARHALEFFSDYFKIPYPGEKLDLIAIPDFAFGAMENFGAITFRESLLLCDEKTTSRQELERITDVISHEIAHMWFGDLVTMKWWNGIWLNEAFATFMELLCVDHFRPGWQRWISFGLAKEQSMAIDGLQTTRPIEFPVNSPDEAQGMFDVLTYQKGASVLRMLEQYLGPEEFQKGISHYLNKHEYSNTETSDLWDALEEVTKQPVRAIAETWIFQGGYPLVNISIPTENLDRKPSSAVIEVTQQPFCYSVGNRPSSEEHIALDKDPTDKFPAGTAAANLWQVPVLIKGNTSSDDTSSANANNMIKLLLRDKKQRVPGEWNREECNWVVGNANGWGFYRVSYSDELFSRLCDHLNQLSPLERFNLLGDTWAGFVANQIKPESFLELVVRLRGNTESSIWSLLAGAFDLMRRGVSSQQDVQKLKDLETFGQLLFHSVLDEIGWEATKSDNDITPTLRATVLETLGTTLEDMEVYSWAKKLYSNSAKSGSAESVDPNLAGAVVAAIAHNGTSADFDDFVDKFHNASTPQEEMRYLYALAGFKSEELIKQTLDMAIGEVRVQNAPYLIQAMLTNLYNGPFVWEFVKTNWDKLLERFPENTIPRMLEGTKYLCNIQDGQPLLAEEIRTFLTSNPIPSGEKSIAQTLERLDINVTFCLQNASSLWYNIKNTLASMARE